MNTSNGKSDFDIFENFLVQSSYHPIFLSSLEMIEELKLEIIGVARYGGKAKLDNFLMYKLGITYHYHQTIQYLVNSVFYQKFFAPIPDDHMKLHPLHVGKIGETRTSLGTTR